MAVSYTHLDVYKRQAPSLSAWPGSNAAKSGRINNIHVMNVTGKGRYLIHIEEAISDCSFMNGIYYGDGDAVTYNICLLYTSRCV